MKIDLDCVLCIQEHPVRITPIGSLEFCDDGRYETTCQFGHKSIIIIQQQKCIANKQVARI